MLKRFFDRLRGKAPTGARRSAAWPAARAAFLQRNPHCAFCGGKEKLEVHHIEPFHVNPIRELHFDNMITLCEAKKGGVTCHLFFGHLGNYKLANPNVASDVAVWRAKFLEARGELGNAEPED